MANYLEEKDHIHIGFSYTNEYGEKFKTKSKIHLDSEYKSEIEELLDSFKKFLITCGYQETTVSHIQFLEDDEWKYVLTQYEEWNEDKEKIYNMCKHTNELMEEDE